MKGHALLQGEIITKNKNALMKLKNLPLQYHRKHSWVKGIQVCSNKGPSLFQGEIITKYRKCIDEIKRFPLQNHLANSIQTWHKAFLGEGIQVCSKKYWKYIGEIYKKNSSFSELPRQRFLMLTFIKLSFLNFLHFESES